MLHGTSTVPVPHNEAVLGYAPRSGERARLQAELARQAGTRGEIRPVVGGAHLATGRVVSAVMPHAHRHVLADAHQADGALVARAIESCLAAARDWGAMSFDARAAVFLKAAELLAGPWRDRLNAATMLGQSKTAHQAEIDAACEMIDFFRFNVAFAQKIRAEQPDSAPGVWNRLEYRPLEGFVYCVTPFNFTSIAGNLPTAPALMGNVCLWKPARSALPSAYELVRLLEAAGLPPGVINFVPGPAADVSRVALDSPHLAGIHFTGSTGTFNHLWREVATRIDRYRAYPRLVGETGGKDFVFAHPSADPDALAVALARGAFEYQGQKCSAASRAYLPRSLWPAVEERLRAIVRQLKMGDVRDFTNFCGAVIDQGAFRTIAGYLDHARATAGHTILEGGTADEREGYFIPPTLVRCDDPTSRLMTEEIFGPVLSLFVYDDPALDATLAICDRSSAYALTGAVFARDRAAIEHMSRALANTAGNFYINDKPTGAVVGQQPFGGARASGTNDKAGSPLNLLRWTSPRTIKETFAPPTDYRYPFLAPDAGA